LSQTWSALSHTQSNTTEAICSIHLVPRYCLDFMLNYVAKWSC